MRQFIVTLILNLTEYDLGVVNQMDFIFDE